MKQCPEIDLTLPPSFDSCSNINTHLQRVTINAATMITKDENGNVLGKAKLKCGHWVITPIKTKKK